MYMFMHLPNIIVFMFTMLCVNSYLNVTCTLLPGHFINVYLHHAIHCVVQNIGLCSCLQGDTVAAPGARGERGAGMSKSA